ncbi:bifunctional acetate--CoA ligase family protein/GNAT family N-acetyltransferase [Kutzneria sp. CA-103260]|uniref:bifunctional acetate--CoA ligase family protein/GNAT family N-acetyltransferase n=1 Tax=Kutzneria sp. CA-103260 TaxID=2802641 RepID=UPI001BAD061A|nr:bifunctional GNAT family N-acetyltransferase/acetate--CoA ligase family protein [Kutzneria sp. CA-103260]QUQ64038.1 acyl-CoA synthetase [Kutzneria sp. CA-103260]
MTGVRALLADGRVALVRRLTPADTDAVCLLHKALPERDIYLRFFTLRPPRLEAFADHLTAPDVRHATLGAHVDGVLTGVATYEVVADPAEAEVALAVDHRQQAHGVGTLLLEHLASLAREHGIRRFVADVLAENTGMLRVFHDLGLPCEVVRGGPEVRVVVPLDPDDRYLDSVTDREVRADVASLARLLRPRSIAVVGAGRRPGTVGHAILQRLVEAGFTGRIMAVNPNAVEIAGVRCYPSVPELPVVPDLTVVAVPAAAVPSVLAECARRKAPAVVVITAGITGEERLHGEVLGTVQGGGFRLVGPNCLGIVNTDPDIRLDASFSDRPARAGDVGVVTQSGGAGIALVDQLAAAGLGVSTMVSTGDKYDVSGNDMLRWWEFDDATRVAVLYLESFGNPRKFSRLARRLARRMPVVALRTGTSEVARRAAASHTAAGATPAVTRDALYRQAGVIAVDTLTDLTATVAVLDKQPLPDGLRVAVITNAGGGGVLAADQCAAHHLHVRPPSKTLRAALGSLLPATASLGNPIDTTAAVSAVEFGRCVRAAMDDVAVDAVLAITVPTALGDPSTELAEIIVKARAAGRNTPVVAVRLTQPESLRLVGAELPSFAEPAVAVAALARAAHYGQWLRRPAGLVPALAGIDVVGARELVDGFLADHSDGGWLSAPDVTTLLRCFGIPALDVIAAADEDAAAAAFQTLSGPVALKAVARGLLHKSAGGGVALGITDESQLRDRAKSMRTHFGGDLLGYLVQPMAAPGRELLVGVVGDASFGPLVVFGLGGTDTDVIDKRVSCLVPVTDVDSHDLLRALPAPKALAGVDVDAVAATVMRVGRLAELLPEVAEMDLNPLIAYATGCVIADARILLRPVERTDATLRALRV